MLTYGFLEGVARIVLFPQRGEICGLDNLPAEPFILAANHRSWYDPALIVLAVMRRRKKKIFFLTERRVVKLVPQFVQNRFGMIPACATGLRKASLLIKEGFSVGIFFMSRRENPKKPSNNCGVAWLAKQTRAPVVPVGITGKVVYGRPIIFIASSIISFFQKKKIIIGIPIFFDREENGHIINKLRSLINSFLGVTDK